MRFGESRPPVYGNGVVNLVVRVARCQDSRSVAWLAEDLREV